MAIAGRDAQNAAPPYALIVLTALTVIFAACAVWMYLNWDKSQQKLTELQQRQTQLGASGKAYNAIEAEAKKAKNRPNVFSYLLSQRDDLRSAIVADPALSNEDIQKTIDGAIQNAQVSLGQETSASLPGLPLSEVLNTLANACQTRNQTIAGLNTSLAAAETSAQQYLAKLQAVQNEAQEFTASTSRETQARQAMVVEQLTQWNANLDQLRNDLDGLQQAVSASKTLAQQQVQDIQETLTKNKKRLQALIDKVQQWRKEGGIDFTGMVSSADGKIVTIVPGQNKVFIDISQTDHLPLSLQFEVFSPDEHITASTKSKGTVQVVRVGPQLSECQVIRISHNQVIMPGDLVVNTVYDRENEYIFRVIGEFDIDGDSRPDRNGAKNVEALIQRWGGKVVPELEVQTDFLVVGAEPLLPEKPDSFDQAAIALYEEKLQERQNYMDIQGRAVDLSIPILNSKRFLYLLGLGDRSELEPLDMNASDPWPPEQR